MYNERSRSAHELLTRESELARNEGAGFVEVHLREGSIVDEILEASSELTVGLIPMGSRELGPV